MSLPRYLPERSRLRFGHRTRKTGAGERHGSRRNDPGKDFDRESPGADRRVLLFERPGALRVDLEDAQAAKLPIRWTEEGPSRDKIAGLMEVGEMRQVGVLQRRGG